MPPTDTLEFDGHCAFALSIGATPPKTNGKHTLTVDGKTYTFLNPVAKFVFRLMLRRNLEKAGRGWAERVAGGA
ncbi:MAG: hypothetical protein KDA24_28395 [Deltaproteobacteria bacterium]|nr:hypothetical protein [Deltaproteobacteria bacterium]